MQNEKALQKLGDDLRVGSSLCTCSACHVKHCYQTEYQQEDHKKIDDNALELVRLHLDRLSEYRKIPEYDLLFL